MIGTIPKLTAGDYGDLVQKVKRLGDHSHFQVGLISFEELDRLIEINDWLIDPHSFVVVLLYSVVLLAATLELCVGLRRPPPRRWW